MVLLVGGEADRKPRRLGLAGFPTIALLQSFGVRVRRAERFDHLE